MRRATILVGLLVVTACNSSADPLDTTPTTRIVVDQTEAPVSNGMTCWSGPVVDEPARSVVFADRTDEMGLIEPLVGMHGHAAVWTDANGDDRPDLFVGSFADRPAERYQFRAASGPSPDRLLLQDDSAFMTDTGFPEMFSRTSGGATADLDLDGDLDLVVSRNFRDHIADSPLTQVLRNESGSLQPVEDPGIPGDFGGRSVAVFDYDLDGLPDVFIAEDRWSGGSSILLRNEGDLKFSDVTEAVGLPPDIHGLGVAVADLNDDRNLDLFVSGSNRLFVANGDGTFAESDSSVFQWEVFGPEDDVAGVSVADVDRDGRLDIAVGHHYNSTLENGIAVQVRLYLNKTETAGEMPVFRDVTDQAGLVPLPTKAPHVELNDFNNDGWPDLLTSASAVSGTEPALFIHTGLEGDVPVFEAPAGLGDPQYWVAAPSVDFDRDGRLDVFALEWEPALPSLLFGNESDTAHWLEISVGPEAGFGLGWRVEVHDSDVFIGAREITVTQGYSAGVLPYAHFGLGDVTEVDVRLVPPGDSEAIRLDGVTADQHLRYPNGCEP